MKTNMGMGWVFESAALLPPAGRGLVLPCSLVETVNRQADEAAIKRGQLPVAKHQKGTEVWTS